MSSLPLPLFFAVLCSLQFLLFVSASGISSSTSNNNGNSNKKPQMLRMMPMMPQMPARPQHKSDTRRPILRSMAHHQHQPMQQQSQHSKAQNQPLQSSLQKLLHQQQPTRRPMLAHRPEAYRPDIQRPELYTPKSSLSPVHLGEYLAPHTRTKHRLDMSQYSGYGQYGINNLDGFAVSYFNYGVPYQRHGYGDKASGWNAFRRSGTDDTGHANGVGVSAKLAQSKSTNGASSGRKPTSITSAKRSTRSR